MVVVGAGSSGPGWGNGKACAVTYARNGAAVVCVDAVLDHARQTVAVIEAEGGTAIAVEADATNEAAIAETVSTAVGTFGAIDVLHNNVGVGGSTGAPDQIDLEMWNREIAVTLNSAFLGIRWAVPVMRKQGRGVITNTSSLMAVRFLRTPQVGYTTAKAAVEALTRSCAVAYGADNIRVNCLRIGFAETPLLLAGLDARQLTDEQKDAALAKSRRKVPLRGQHTDAFDVAHAALFLASDAAKHITGQILNVDGGLECAPI
ncbi:SDR family NAD(P)-dependent oxidoreductase [Nocardia colli]|uniref:SDR family NAD(P)-dependent oxidoreductase n=1 Tax=Nocardia colli TaxID=2545717 RepID=UPI00168D9879|nr:SDR family oxidoreductase [Nocardia colli]